MPVVLPERSLDVCLAHDILIYRLERQNFAKQYKPRRSMRLQVRLDRVIEYFNANAAREIYRGVDVG
jgi:hypothetical protein